MCFTFRRWPFCVRLTERRNREVEKEKYAALEMETIEFDVEDVIRISPEEEIPRPL